MNIKKLALVSLGVLGTAVALTGCSTTTMVDAQSKPYSVVMTSSGGLTEDRQFSYVDSEGDLQKLNHCGQKSFFSNHICATANDTVMFEYYVAKGGRLADTTITVAGVKHKTTCHSDGDDFWSDKQICILGEVKN